MNVSVVVPFKGTSERIPSKNLQLLDGKPLFLHTLESLLSCEAIQAVYLDTEDDTITKMAQYIDGLSFLKRPKELANNSTDGNKIYTFEAEQIECDILIQRLCTSPFIRNSTILQALHALIHSSHDSIVGIKTAKQYLWDGNTPQYDIQNIPNSVDLPKTGIETMGLYAMSRCDILRLKRRIGNNPFQLEMDSLESLDVNWPDDFVLANLVAAGIREECRKNFKLLGACLNTPIFSDILDDLGYPKQGLLKKDPPAGSKYCARSARCRPSCLAIQRPVNRPFQVSICS